tara:strand:- start:256 stop:417 length:162 start_codon:yes stop_codon:yes gene_type:complete
MKEKLLIYGNISNSALLSLAVFLAFVTVSRAEWIAQDSVVDDNLYAVTFLDEN